MADERPLADCTCIWHAESRGAGYVEVVPELDPACPVHGPDLVGVSSDGNL